MRRPRLTIGTLMAVVLLAAADIGIVRALWGLNGSHAGVAIVTLPMVDVLLLAPPALWKSGAGQPFRCGFQAAGWIGVLAIGVLASTAPETAFLPINYAEEHLFPSPLTDGALAIEIAVAVVLHTTPPLLVALLAGRLNAKYRVLIDRRPAASRNPG